MESDRSSKSIQLCIHVSGQIIHALKGDTILDALLDGGIAIEHECGGNCSCTTCHITVIEGEYNLSEVEWPESERLNTLEIRKEYSRLGCQAILLAGPIKISIG